MELLTGDVAVWRVAATPANSRAAEAARAALSEEETRRAGTFHKPADRALYLVAHVALRLLLGEQLGLPAGAVVLGRAACPGCGGPHGRPVTVSGPSVEFSLSHTGGLAVIALARDVVGVDVEQRGPFEEAAGLDIASQLHPAERAVLDGLPQERRAEATLRCWVRKEAYLKGTGVGLSQGVDADYVGLGPEYPGLAGGASLPAEPAGWGFGDVPVPDGYAAAVALRLPDGVRTPRVVSSDLDLGQPVRIG
ncbi:4'-phosphopantetheinyl transferase superfamily protein [Kitasatospora atroaurantiaca]|uniref:4'-phosphopantetheinyl transferase n=1 Tax=Kitasatospora atroaurantiaca TaxID=285545 RepID=A0A561ES76_9ACTN|nr:4'-phosphopantetheinyl transferase superfamily protein [Kitasatospora atroaurantiaca]TWE18470.1 4'-phosphopantetheinyl transferase [Kitasatospora atroaurantiaca]